MKQTAVEWLAEKYNYVTWMRNRDEISAGLADEWRKHYLEQAKEMEREQIIEAYRKGVEEDVYVNPLKTGTQYFNETFKTKNHD